MSTNRLLSTLSSYIPTRAKSITTRDAQKVMLYGLLILNCIATGNTECLFDLINNIPFELDCVGRQENRLTELLIKEANVTLGDGSDNCPHGVLLEHDYCQSMVDNSRICTVKWQTNVNPLNSQINPNPKIGQVLRNNCENFGSVGDVMAVGAAALTVVIFGGIVFCCCIRARCTKYPEHRGYHEESPLLINERKSRRDRRRDHSADLEAPRERSPSM